MALLAAASGAGASGQETALEVLAAMGGPMGEQIDPGLRRALLALHAPMDQEVERWPDDEFEPPVLTECTLTIKVCRECGHDVDIDGGPVFRGWPCPTLRLFGEPVGGT